MGSFSRSLRCWGAAVCRQVVLWFLAVLAVSGCGRTAIEYLRDAQQARTVEERERCLSRAVARDPSLRPARLARARLYVSTNQNAKAIADYEYLEKSSRFAGEKATLLFERGGALERNGQLAEAVESYTQAAQVDPRLFEPYPARANAYFQMGKYTESMSDWQTVLDRDLGHGSPAGLERRGEWRLQRGVAAFCAGEWDIAVRDFKGVLGGAKSEAVKGRAFLNLYLVVCRIGDRKSAAEVLKAYAAETYSSQKASDPATPWILFATWHAAGLLTEEQFLELSKHRNPQAAAERTAGAYYYIGACQLVKSMNERAREAFEKATQSKNLESLEYHMAAVELERLRAGGKSAGDYAAMAAQTTSREKGIELYSEALRVDPNHTDARLKRAMLYSAAGHYDLAIEDCTRLLELYKSAGNKAVALRYRGLMYAQKGDHVAAVKDFEAAIAADPEMWQAREGLGISLGYLRKYKEAAETYGKLVSVGSNAGMQGYWQLECGYALCCAGEWAAAVGRFHEVGDKAGEAPIVHTNLFIAEARLEGRAKAEEALKTYASGISKPGWGSSVAWYAANMLDDARLLKMSEHSESQTQLVRTCRAWYYIGAVRLIRGEKEQAREAFEKCVELGRTTRGETWEYRMAMAELARSEQWR